MEQGQLRWGVEQRLEFIETVLYWQGTINRGDIMARFGVSVPQASADIKKYREVAPGNMEYDGRFKKYVAAEAFSPVLTEPSAEDYLSHIKGAEGQNSVAPYSPPFDDLKLPERLISPRILRFVTMNIQGNSDIQIRYQSMTRPKPIWRWVTPHALGNDGRRWHFRAYCHMDGTFKDFLFSRVLETKSKRASKVSSTDDEDWNEIVVAKISPNSQLPLPQQKVVASDYGMRRGVMKITVRRSMLFYLLQRLNLLDNETLASTSRYLELRNRDELLPMIKNQKQSELAL